jgi:outer membrane protein TolC
MDAARRRIGAARAAQFPGFSLTATGGTQSSDLSKIANLSTQQFTSLIGSIVTPVFQGGRLKAEVEVARALFEQLTANYEKTVLTSIKEVNAALVQFEKEKDRYAFLLSASENAEASAQNQEDRYERGIGDYLAYLDARVNLLRTSNALELARQSVANARLGVHRALGGGWVTDPDNL